MTTHRIHTNREPVNRRQRHPRSQASWQVPVRQARQVLQPAPPGPSPKAGSDVAFYVILLAVGLAAVAMGVL